MAQPPFVTPNTLAIARRSFLIGLLAQGPTFTFTGYLGAGRPDRVNRGSPTARMVVT